MSEPKRNWAPIKSWPSLWLKHIVSGGQGWFWFAALLVVLLTPIIVTYCFAGNKQQTALRIAGMVFQLIGFLMALLGIEGSLRFAGAPTVARGCLTYVTGFVTALRVKTIHLSPCAAVSRAQVSSGFGTVGTHPDATIEQRLSQLEEGLDLVRKSVWEQGNKFSQIEERIEKNTKELGQEVRAQVQELREYVNTQQLGNAQQEIVGIVFFALGVVYSTVPDLLVDFVNRFIA